jgi:hypothetical protein
MKLAESSAQSRSWEWSYPSKVQIRVNVTRVHNSVGSSNPTRSNVKEGYDEGMGRVLLSTCSFNPGDIVLTDTPLVKFRDHLHLAKKYARMNEEERALIMDLKHLGKPKDAEHSECEDYLQKMWVYARKLVAREPKLRNCSRTEVFKLLSCSLFNGHGSELDSAALYPLFSRAAHSCSPNCMSTVHPSLPQEVSYMATKPIAPGEMLTVSYAETSKPTIARRTELRSAVL